MITSEQIEDYLSLEYELPNVECKGPGNLDDNPLLGKVIRAVISMANRHAGGTVIIGIAEGKNHSLSPEGLTDEQKTTWQPDLIADKLNSYATPSISFEYQSFQWSKNNRWFIFLTVAEFNDIPIICKQNYIDDFQSLAPEKRRDKVILRKGAMYVRTPNKAETKETTDETMRELLERATAKGIRKFLTTARLGNLTISVRPGDEELFDQQQKSWSSELIDLIKTRGYWQIIMRPEQFEPKHLKFSKMMALVQQTSIQLRGTFFPTLSPRRTPPGNDWVGVELQEAWRLEAWRLYQSGQLLLYTSLLEDWQDKLNNRYLSEGWKSGLELSVEGVVFRLLEIYEYAAHLASEEDYHLKGKIRVELTLSGLQGRALQISPRTSQIPLFRDFATEAQEISYSGDYSKEELLTQAREMSLSPALEIFDRFGWNPSLSFIQGIQAQLPSTLG